MLEAAPLREPPPAADFGAVEIQDVVLTEAHRGREVLCRASHREGTLMSWSSAGAVVRFHQGELEQLDLEMLEWVI